MRHHFTPTKMAIIKKTDWNPHTLLVEYKMVQALWKRVWQFSRKLKHTQGFPVGTVVENLPNAGDTGLRPGLGRSHMPQSS